VHTEWQPEVATGWGGSKERWQVVAIRWWYQIRHNVKIWRNCQRTGNMSWPSRMCCHVIHLQALTTIQPLSVQSPVGAAHSGHGAGCDLLTSERILPLDISLDGTPTQGPAEQNRSCTARRQTVSQICHFRQKFYAFDRTRWSLSIH
jgi:hypothetical protein